MKTKQTLCAFILVIMKKQRSFLFCDFLVHGREHRIKKNVFLSHFCSKCIDLTSKENSFHHLSDGGEMHFQRTSILSCIQVFPLVPLLWKFTWVSWCFFRKCWADWLWYCSCLHIHSNERASVIHPYGCAHKHTHRCKCCHHFRTAQSGLRPLSIMPSSSSFAHTHSARCSDCVCCCSLDVLPSPVCTDHPG